VSDLANAGLLVVDGRSGEASIVVAGAVAPVGLDKVLRKMPDIPLGKLADLLHLPNEDMAAAAMKRSKADDVPVFRGGRHGTTKGPKHDGLDSHHMPADSINGPPTDKGPAIQMLPEHHKMTASHGSGKSATLHRDQQAALIKQDQFGAAMQLDIDNTRELFDDMYNDAIGEMLDSADEWMLRGLTEPLL
jgi:hypothetical protein